MVGGIAGADQQIAEINITGKNHRRLTAGYLQPLYCRAKVVKFAIGIIIRHIRRRIRILEGESVG